MAPTMIKKYLDNLKEIFGRIKKSITIVISITYNIMPKAIQNTDVIEGISPSPTFTAQL
jgi:hypothetical protein